MSNLLGVDATLALLDRLKSTVGDFAAREEQLVQKFHALSVRERLRFETASEEEDARLANEITSADSCHQTAQDRIQSQSELRKARIVRACQTAKLRRREKIDQHEGRQKYEIQRDRLETSRRREESLLREENTFVTFTNDLAQESEALVALEARTQKLFRGHREFQKLLAVATEPVADELSPDENLLLEQLRERNGQLGGGLHRLRKLGLGFKVKLLPMTLSLFLILLVYVPFFEPIHHFGIGFFSLQEIVLPILVLVGLASLLQYLEKRATRPAALGVISALRRARQLHAACAEKSGTRHEQELLRIQNKYDTRLQAFDQEREMTSEDAVQKRKILQETMEAKRFAVPARNETLRERKLERLQHQHTQTVTRLQNGSETRRRQIEAARAKQETQARADDQALWQTLETDWKERIQPLSDALTQARETADKLFPEWKDSFSENWSPPSAFACGAQFGYLNVDLEKLAGNVPKDKRLTFPGPPQFCLPLSLTIPGGGSILLETNGSELNQVMGVLNHLVLRLLSVSAPGKVNFTIIDPVELGQNFSGLMHLADFEPGLINDRIWTQPAQIEQRLANLNERIEKVTQMYLRNEYETIADYNQQAGRNAEKYHFLIVAKFPANFTDLAVKRLLSIAASGARCGVYTLLHWDLRRPMPQELVPGELKKNSLCLRSKGNAFVLAGKALDGATLVLSPPPSPKLATEFLQKVGRCSIDSNRVEIPFAEIIPPESQLWSRDLTEELRVPIGVTGATKLQSLLVGKGTRQHALIAGKTGSGKSTLFHVIITNLALWCPPDQIEFYLVDFKKGVEFKCYATERLPHARVVAIESDREFALSVLERVDGELKRRGDLFRKAGVQDLAGYKKAGGGEPLPRTLLIIDEFQEYFVEDDRISQSAALLLDRIVRQGRAFGIHVLLGSQTLGGAYTLARTTLGQMVIRIALQCNEADACLIMNDDNPAPRLLSRPGEAIYNDTAGTIEGNSPFQTVWLPNDVREIHLKQIRRLADQTSTLFPGPIVFEGNAPADVVDNGELRQLLEASSLKPVAAARVWLGAPNSIKGPTDAVFHRQSGHHLLIVGQREEAILAMMGISLLSLAAQHPRDTARFILLDASPPGSAPRAFLEKLLQAIPHDITLVKTVEIPELMANLTEELEKRSDPKRPAAATTYLFIHRLQNFKSLRYDEDFGFSSDAKSSLPPGHQLDKLICEGASVGLHVLCACDTGNNLSRFLSRKAVSEFEMRVLFQMSANDSASLIDTPKANDLGLHRAIFSNGHEGYLETFRPYMLPSHEWMEAAGRNLTRLLGHR